MSPLGRFLRQQAAWVVLSVLLGGVWWLMTHAGGVSPTQSAPVQPAPGSDLSLSAPATVTLATGQTIHGTVTGAQALCPSWQDQLATGTLTVTLPGGQVAQAPQITAVTMTPATLDGLATLVTATACGDTLTLHAP